VFGVPGVPRCSKATRTRDAGLSKAASRHGAQDTLSQGFGYFWLCRSNPIGKGNAMKRAIVLTALFALVVVTAECGCNDPIIYRDSHGVGYRHASELPRVPVRPGQVFVPGPDVKWFVMTNETPLRFSSMDYPNQIVKVLHANPGEESLEGPGLYKVVFLPHGYDEVSGQFTGASTQPPVVIQQPAPIPQPVQPTYMPQPEPAYVQPPQSVYVPQPQPVYVPPSPPPPVVQQPREHTCPTCGGTGRILCNACGGRGVERCSTCGASGKVTCRLCNGLGKQGNSRCGGCNGMGRVNCPVCFGGGTKNCSACSSLFGTRNGQIVCQRCNGTGKITF